jgi:alanine racemase
MSVIHALIDTGALRHNLCVLRAKAAGSRIATVVKANAYGHGLIAVARATDGDALAVARLEEAQALRTAGITRPVLLLEGVCCAQALQQAVSEHLELVVHEPGLLALLVQQRPKELILWLKIDTGMNRLGFRPEHLPEVLEQLGRLAPKELRLMTHLACADEPDNPMTAAQVARFEAATRGLPYSRSICASAGLLAGAASSRSGDWMRPGIALYGVSPFMHASAADLGLKPVMTLESQVIAVREVPRGERVGYGATWQAPRDSRVAIVAAGYADGLLRSLPSGTPVLIGGQRASLAGRISMDMCAVDVTGLADVTPGTRVVLWGEGLPVEEIARHAGTIPYELLCAVSARVPLVTR